ncbi:hypothetical protein TREMEDRAFT_55784 [Tremella mesenterica DSM 1558]|uniref:uncharacterized protein n=1 Tax=Tremella mesenterica (strain ATCC 24925 / CBS 8224 / DSM 1558 / NBRC 9311 / NRRL Y-6157 / RJB 2259-6 / UBC 559-6) TaxID=578456 RepID=UPI0003F49DA8|nr:uncharacterized protein TREMEDRAFT_55784 [Tremella mesenterica DSM 1558]EIW71960.1 hypothetical protein TREMEDRAFT_55784 [Tremella mesenterica DSM 1558]
MFPLYYDLNGTLQFAPDSHKTGHIPLPPWTGEETVNETDKLKWCATNKCHRCFDYDTGRVKITVFSQFT